MNNQEKIVEMFNQIAPTYDKTNRIISFGVDISWRKTACKWVLEKFKNKTISIADVACGTGDMIKIWQEMANDLSVKIEKITGIDPSVGMLEVAKKKILNSDFIEAKADNTTLENKSVDMVSISYGIRNVVEREKALKEFNRIIKYDGYLVVLEFTKSQKKDVASKIKDFYISKMLPKIGGFVSKNKEAYEYLPNSIENFLDTESFKKELSSCGFEMQLCKGFSFDVCTLFIAKKIKNL